MIARGRLDLPRLQTQMDLERAVRSGHQRRLHHACRGLAKECERLARAIGEGDELGPPGHGGDR